MTTPERDWETPRLLARPATTADALTIFDGYASDPAVAKYLTWKPHRSVDETIEFLRRCERAWIDRTAFPWSLWLKDEGAFAGLIEIRVRPREVDVGYALARRWWSQGLMSEAVRFVVQWAFAQPRINRVSAICDAENVASSRLLERVGMRRERVLSRYLVHPNMGDAPRDCLSYAIVKAG